MGGGRLEGYRFLAMKLIDSCKKRGPAKDKEESILHKKVRDHSRAKHANNSHHTEQSWDTHER